MLHADIRDLIRDKIVGAINENVLAHNPERKETLLSGLWNLTDENPFACQTLIDVGGLEFLIKLMKHVDNRVNDHVDEVERCQDLIRIMGVMLNVGLCRTTRKKIEQNDVKKILVQLIDETIGGIGKKNANGSGGSGNAAGRGGAGGGGGGAVAVNIDENLGVAAVDVPPAAGAAAEEGGVAAAEAAPRYPMMGFLASGILAAIACDDPKKVRTYRIFGFLDNSSAILKKIKLAVKSLNDPFFTSNNNNNHDNVNNNNNNESEISLGFSSFKSIFTMLKTDRPSAVHHWALWGVANACSAQPHRHVPMLQREGGFKLLSNILKHDKDADVKHLAKRLIDFTRDYNDLKKGR